MILQSAVEPGDPAGPCRKSNAVRGEALGQKKQRWMRKNLPLGDGTEHRSHLRIGSPSSTLLDLSSRTGITPGGKRR